MAILYLFNVATSAIIIFRGIEVMSTSSRGAAADCVRLQSSDGDTFEVSLKVAKLSRTIETMLRGEYLLIVWLVRYWIVPPPGLYLNLDLYMSFS